MVFQGSSFSFDVGMLLSAFLYASSAAFFFALSSAAFGVSCCCLFPFPIPWACADVAISATATAAMTVFVVNLFCMWATCPFRKSYPDVLVMQPCQDGNSDNGTRPLGCST